MAYPEKYHHLLDRQIWKFIRDTEKTYPADAVELTVAKQRELYDAMCIAARAALPGDISFKNLTIPSQNYSIPIRRYEPNDIKSNSEIVFFHGGGFIVGGLESHHDLCAEICSASGVAVTAVDYRLSPEHPFPKDIEDAVTAFQFVANAGKNIILVGDSAGGTLAAAVSHLCRENEHPPSGQVLIYPALAGTCIGESNRIHEHAPMLTTADMKFYREVRSNNCSYVQQDPRFAPLNDTNFSNLPPTVLFAAQCDPLNNDCSQYFSNLKSAGVSVQCIEERGLVHGYLRARHSSTRANQSFSAILDSISLLCER